MLQLCQVNKFYQDQQQRDRQVLEDVSLLAIPGDFIGIWGEHRAGKTTLLSIMAGLIPKDSGEIRFNLITPSQPSRLTISLLGHSSHPATDITVRQYLFMATSPLQATECHDAVQQRLYRLILECRLEHVLDQSLHELTPEQIQFAALAYSLLGRPQVLLADEPTFGLLQDTRLLQRLTDIALKGHIVIMTSSNLQALRYCNRLFVLEEGRLRPTKRHAQADMAMV